MIGLWLRWTFTVKNRDIQGVIRGHHKCILHLEFQGQKFFFSCIVFCTYIHFFIVQFHCFTGQLKSIWPPEIIGKMFLNEKSVIKMLCFVLEDCVYTRIPVS